MGSQCTSVSVVLIRFVTHLIYIQDSDFVIEGCCRKSIVIFMRVICSRVTLNDAIFEEQYVFLCWRWGAI